MATLAGVIVGVSTPQEAIAQPTISHVTPGALAPGKTTEIRLHGAKLNHPLRIWTSFPAQIEPPASSQDQNDQTQAACKITLSAGVPLGVGGIVVVTSEGVSDVLYVMIDDLPSVADRGDNHNADNPQDLSLPVAIDGQSAGTLFDYFRFTAKAGEKISCEVLATRLGWDFDPFVRVLDSRGKEIIVADDDPSTGPDTRFVFTAPADGSYLLELRDNGYKPGGRYRLRLGDFPLAAARARPITAGGLPMFAEHDANSQLNQSTPAQVPGVVAGILQTAGEQDLFQFDGIKGTRVGFRAITRSAGSAAIVALRLLNQGGKQIAESAVGDSDEPVLNFTLPADSGYQLVVQELGGRGGPEYSYAVECSTGPQFSLSLKNDKANRLRYAVPGSSGAFFLDVQCQRSGYDGPIALAVDSPRLGWQVFNNSIPSKANEVRLYIVAPVDYSPGELTDLRIIGSADSDGRRIEASMLTTTQLRAARPQTPYPPAWHDGAIFVGGTSPISSFYTLTAPADNLEFSRDAGQARLKLRVERHDPKFKDALTVLPFGLPPGMTAEVKREGAGANETYEVVLKGPKELPAGQHTFRYFAYGELNGQGKAITSGDIPLSLPAP